MELKTQEISQGRKSEPLKPLTRKEILETLRSGRKVYFVPKVRTRLNLSNLMFIITPTSESGYDFQLDWIGDSEYTGATRPFGIEAPDKWMHNYNYYDNYWTAWGEWQKYQQGLTAVKKHSQS